MHQEFSIQQKANANVSEHPLQASGFEATNVSAPEPSLQLKASESPIQANGFSPELVSKTAETFGDTAASAVQKANVVSDPGAAASVGALGYTQMTGGAQDTQNVVIGDGSAAQHRRADTGGGAVQRHAPIQRVPEGETAVHEAMHVAKNAMDGASANQLKSEADASAGGQAVHTADESAVEGMTSRMLS